MNRKDQVDKDVQERLAYLRKKIPITTKYVESDKEAAKALSMRITPIIAKETTTLEDLQNANLQRQIAEENLKTIMKPADVADALRMLLELDDVVNFNSYFTGFKSEYRHQKNFTPEYFRGLWLKYSEKIDRETIPVKGMIPTRIPISRPSAEQTLAELGQIEGEEPIAPLFPTLEAEAKAKLMEKDDGKQQIIENIRVITNDIKDLNYQLDLMRKENALYKKINKEDNKELVESIKELTNEIQGAKEELDKNRKAYKQSEILKEIKITDIKTPIEFDSMSDLEKAKFYRESLDDYIRNRRIAEAEASDTIPPKAYETQILTLLKNTIDSGILKKDGSINIGYNQYKYTDMLRNLDESLSDKEKMTIPKHVLERIYSNITKIQNSQTEGELADITTKIKTYTKELQDKNDAIAEKEDEIFRLNSSLRIKKVAEMDETKQNEFIKETAEKLRKANGELKTLKEERNKIKESTDIKKLEQRANTLINRDISKSRKAETEEYSLLKDLITPLQNEEAFAKEASLLESSIQENRLQDAKGVESIIEKAEEELKKHELYVNETLPILNDLQATINEKMEKFKGRSKESYKRNIAEYKEIQSIINSPEFKAADEFEKNKKAYTKELDLYKQYRDDLLNKDIPYRDIVSSRYYRDIKQKRKSALKPSEERERLIELRADEENRRKEKFYTTQRKESEEEFKKIQKQLEKKQLAKMERERGYRTGEAPRREPLQISPPSLEFDISSLPNNVMQMKKMLNELEKSKGLPVTKKIESLNSMKEKYADIKTTKKGFFSGRRVSEEELLSGFSQASTPQQSRRGSQSTPKFEDESTPRQSRMPKRSITIDKPRITGALSERLTPINPPSRKSSAKSVEIPEFEEKKSEGSGRRGGNLSQRASNVPIKQRIIQGRGVDYEKIEDRYNHQIPVSKRFKKIIDAPFGQYSIHLPSLVKNTINVRYMSGSHALPFPKDVISNELKSMILDIIEEGKYDEANYIALSEKEKKLFDDLITLAKVDIDTSLRMWRHKKYDDDEKKKKIDRFNLLKAQLLAGNDNKNIIREIKQLMLYLQEHKLIQKSDFNKIMYYIVYST